MTKSRRRAEDRLESDLKSLPKLPRTELQKRWVELYETPCPTQISRRILTRALAYRMQEQAFGGLDALTFRRLARAERDLAAGRPVASPVPKIKPGTRLLREWNGKVHEVIVLERGVRYRDQTWPSLSAVAREITGTRWSGPRFFGLVKGASA